MVFILRGSDVNYGMEDLKVTSRCQQTQNKSIKSPTFALISSIVTTE